MNPTRSIAWAAGAFAGGVLLNIDRVPAWVPVAALLFVIWRLVAAVRATWLPNTALRSLVALALVGGVVLRFHTLNGLSAGTALLVLMGSIKLLETRAQRDQYIVVAAGLFLLLAACLDRQNLLRTPLYLLQAWVCCSALAVVSYAAPVAPGTVARAFSRDPRMSGGGRTRHPQLAAGFGDRAAVLLAGRSLLYALPLAALLFVFFPRIPGAFWAIPRTGEATTGLSDTMSPGSITRLTSSYDVAFRAKFTGPLPPPQERYWRGPVLHDFDGYTWRRSPNSYYRQQPLEYLGTAYRYRISLEPSSQRWWFSLDTATGSPDSKVYFTYDYQLMSAEPVTEVTSYDLVSHTSTRSNVELSRLARRHDTALPEDRNPRSRELALKLRSRVTSDAAYVDAVMDYLRSGGFTYSVTPPALGTDSVDDFLFDTRVGFCGHYASAFVSLMRAADVPARVVTGYLGGEWNPVGQYFIVRQADAHSWAEVWLEGRGWTRVDPTGVVAPERLRRGILDLLPDAVSAPARFVWSTPWLMSMLQRWDALNAWWNDRVVRFNYDDQLRILERLGFDSPGARQLAWIFAGGLVGWMLWIAWRVGRTVRLQRPDRLARAYDRLCMKLGRAGIIRQPHQGPLAYADEVARNRPDLASPVRTLIMNYSRLRYGPPAPDSHTRQVSRFERDVARLTLEPS